MIYYAIIAFILANGKEEPLVSIPVGGGFEKCTQVLQHRIAQRAALGGLKGYKPQCAALPAPK